MKHLLTITICWLLVVPVCGQVDTSIKFSNIVTDSSHRIWISSSVAGNNLSPMINTGYTKIDTSAVWIMITESTPAITDKDTSYLGFRICTVIPGYTTQEVTYISNMGSYFWSGQINYLDRFKRPLKKDWIIWDTKPRVEILIK